MSALQTPSAPERLGALIAAARAVDGQPPFSDQSLVELERGERTLVTSERGSDAEGAALIGAAVVGTDEFELVVHPDARGAGVGTDLVRRVLAEHPAATHAWAHGDHPASRALAARFGFEPVRTLLQLHADLDSPSAAALDPRREDRDHLRVTDFRPGIDDEQWLALNARAFADHPEQGRLTLRDLDDRTAEAWFDAGDFLILRDGDAMIGFCWLKVEGTIGEFYAVGVDPARQGEGLGRVLMDAGIARLAARGIRTAVLYVEADNAPALALYSRYGFTQHTIDIRYRLIAR
ncbi:mycothiol synthase [Cryobacterium mesophilum]|uniref:mycothiol synthase n=1 Tax=Terrimesophilobacter mesophilus TaxID=433647 RepID=UPI0014257677|nr:mycothiol synthase [Terrimesophilobacter mesophilus]MBB5632789.1 mycothiol synthase [Terrimesophilobacter mesophilus]